MSYRIAIATCAAFADLDDEGKEIVAALTELGHDAHPAVWNDPDVDWSAFDGVVIRSTWDYIDHYDDFLSWAWRVSGQTVLLNPEKLVRWFADKRYLRDVESHGIAIVPTQFITIHDATLEHDYLDVEHVIKPSIGAGGQGIQRFAATEREASIARLEELRAAGKTVMVSPWLTSLEDNGETALIYLGGKYSHAVNKKVALGEVVEGTFAQETVALIEPTEAQRQLADGLFEALPEDAPTLYMRVDLVTGNDGELLVLEIETVEPSLFLNLVPGASKKFAELVVAQISEAKAEQVTPV